MYSKSEMERCLSQIGQIVNAEDWGVPADVLAAVERLVLNRLSTATPRELLAELVRRLDAPGTMEMLHQQYMSRRK